MTQLKRIVCLVMFALALLPSRGAAQSGTVTDDAFLSINPTTQQVNANGYGFVLIVAGSSAAGSPGTTTAFLKFQLQSSLPPNVAANNVAKATLKLFLANQGPSPSGTINNVHLSVFVPAPLGPGAAWPLHRIWSPELGLAAIAEVGIQPRVVARLAEMDRMATY